MVSNLWGRCHILYMRATDSMPMSHVTQAVWAARDHARLLEATPSQGTYEDLSAILGRLEAAVTVTRMHLLAIQADAEYLRRDIEDAIARRPEPSEGQVWADAYRNIIAHRKARP
jgi:hypothetical protein